MVTYTSLKIVKNPEVIHLIRLLVVLIFVNTTTGCMFSDLKKEIQEGAQSYVMEGQVFKAGQGDGKAIVLLYSRRKNGLELHRFTFASDSGRFSFIVTPGTYLLAGFEDLNTNMRHDAGEPAGTWENGADITVYQGLKTDARKETLIAMNFSLTAGDFPVAGGVSSLENLEQLSTSFLKFGELAEWDDSIFDDANGTTGFWKPLTFLKQFGAGIYFLEPFNHTKIPILFIHGANGTPRGWKPLADSLDRQRYQPWVLYYPSGARLSQVAIVLNGIVKRLQRDYGFERMGVVAHSMGGLVSRAFILRHRVMDGLDTIKVFVSISTPWGGVPMAAKGVDHAPEAIPSWHDVAPKSQFIESIYSDALHARVPHYLIFGYRGDCSLFMANSDGTIELASQLDQRAQDDAAAVWGLDEDHMSILVSETTMAYMNQAIASAFED